MGLVFAIQPDLRKSKAPELLVLKSSKRKFSLGMGFIFGGALLGTMFLAASPLFRLLWTEGAFFDQAVTAFILSLICLYPLLALACWFFEETVTMEQGPSGSYTITAYEGILGFHWAHRHIQNVGLDQLAIENWKGSLNVAALDPQAEQVRYATKGHWILKVKDKRLPRGEIALERRAKQDDVEFLLAQIKGYFAPTRPSSTSKTVPSTSTAATENRPLTELRS